MSQLRKHHQDYWLSLAVFGLIIFGLIMIYSVSKYYSLQITNEATDKYFLKKQLFWLAVGVGAWIVTQSIDYRFWQNKSKYMLAITLIALLIPIIVGGGSGERWVNLGFSSLQPSEIVKLSLIFYLSSWFANKGEDLAQVKKMFISFVIVIFVVALFMLIQKDLGSLAVIILIASSIFFMAGAPIYQLLTGAGFGSFLLWLAIKLEPYRLERFLTFLNPENSDAGATYHIRNALIAVGSGGIWGLGFGQSKQKYLYLPEAHTDSIFAIVAEELGFLRAGMIVIIFAFIAIRGYRIASRAPDTFSRLVATGITTWIIGQMFINVAAMLSLVPLTGVPLPFISYGGTSLIMLLAAVGVLVNISKHQNIYPGTVNKKGRV